MIWNKVGFWLWHIFRPYPCFRNSVYLIQQWPHIFTLNLFSDAQKHFVWFMVGLICPQEVKGTIHVFQFDTLKNTEMWGVTCFVFNSQMLHNRKDDVNWFHTPNLLFQPTLTSATWGRHLISQDPLGCKHSHMFSRRSKQRNQHKLGEPLKAWLLVTQPNKVKHYWDTILVLAFNSWWDS